MIYIGLAAVIFLADLFIKNKIEKEFKGSDQKEIFNGRIHLRKVYNKGAALNLLEKRPEIIKYLSAFLAACTGLSLVVLIFRRGHTCLKVGLSCLLGGALSNVYDRYIRGYVIDYFSFKTKFKKLNKIVFNLSDMFIFLGAAITALADVFKK